MVGGMASWTQQGLAFLVQTSASIFYRYKVVVAADKTTWSRPSSLVTQRQTRIVRDLAGSVQGRRSRWPGANEIIYRTFGVAD